MCSLLGWIAVTNSDTYFYQDWACQIIFFWALPSLWHECSSSMRYSLLICVYFSGSPSQMGQRNDIVAFRKTSLFRKKINSLPIGKYVISDNAYVCSENSLTPFSGQQRLESAKDSFYFYLSQLQIRIEMTFGHFMNRWGLFKCPLQMCLKNVGIVFMCTTWLHNFCIIEKNDTVDLEDSDNYKEQQEGSAAFMQADVNVVSVPGNSILCDLLLEEIASRALVHPSHNIQRNRDNMD
jgi:hypothetical protein